jgi:UMP-CMP kinase
MMQQQHVKLQRGLRVFNVSEMVYHAVSGLSRFSQSRVLFSQVLFGSTATVCEMKSCKNDEDPIVVIVLGGPGSGKGTQCANIQKEFGFVHLSAGELLRREMDSKSEVSSLIKSYIDKGAIVPSEITVSLLDKEIRESGKNKFLIDGFPRNFENNQAFEKIILTHVRFPFILFFECPEQVLQDRLLGRGNSSTVKRSDDNIDVIKKRFQTYSKETLPVVNFYKSKNKVIAIDANRSREEIFKDIKLVFQSLLATLEKK